MACTQNPQIDSKTFKEILIAEEKALGKKIAHKDRAVLREESQAALDAMVAKNRSKGEGIKSKLRGFDTKLDTKLRSTLKKLYPEIELKDTTQEILHGEGVMNQEAIFNEYNEIDPVIAFQKDGKNQIKGQADIEAKTVLINSLLQSQDTLPHEYAHHYIAMFRDAPIVQEAIKKWGSEEALVQAIGEQTVEQKGEAYGWWKEFTKWLQGKFDNLSGRTKEDLRNLLTDAFLARKDLNMDKRWNKNISKKGTVLGHVSDKTFSEVKTASEGTFWLGFHIGTNDVVEDYANQVYKQTGKDAKVKLYTIKLKEDLRPIELEDNISDWTANNMTDNIKKQHPETVLNKDADKVDVLNELKRLGYNAVAYHNNGEGAKLDRRVNSIIILDKNTVEMTKTTQTTVSKLPKALKTEKIESGIEEKVDTLESGVTDISKSVSEETLGSKFDETIDLETLNEYLYQEDPTKSKFENIEHELIQLDKKREGVEFDEEHSKHLSEVTKKLSEAMKTTAGLDIQLTKQEADKATTGQYHTGTKKITVAVEEDLGAEFSNEFTQSHQEVYAHESVHAVLEFAHEQGGSEVQDDLQQLRRLWELSNKYFTDKHGKDNGWKALLPKDESLYSEAAVKEAQNKYKHIYESTNSKEFEAHLMTNKEFAEALEPIGARVIKEKIKDEAFVDRVKRVFMNLVNKALGRVKEGGKTNVRVAATKLVYRLAKAEKNAADKAAGKAKTNIGSEGLRLYTKALDSADTKFGKLADTVIRNTIGETDRKGKKMTKADMDLIIAETKAVNELMTDSEKRNPFMRVYRLARALPKLRTLSSDLPEVARMTDAALTSIGLREDTVIREIVEGFLTQDATYTAMTDAILKSTHDIDGVREAAYEDVKADVKGWFKNVDLGKKENLKYDEALSAVLLRADVQALGIDAEELSTLLKDRVELEKRVTTFEDGLKESTLMEMEKLSNYMITGEGLVTNAFNIAHKENGGMPSEGLIEQIDRAVTYRALLHVDTSAAEAMVDLIEQDAEGVDNFIGYSKGVQDNKKNDLNYLKGEIKETFDRDATILIRPTAKKKEMEAKGFRLIKRVDPITGEAEDMSMYVSKYGAVAKRVNGAMSIQEEDKHGRTIRDRIIEEGKIENPAEMKAEYKKRLDTLSREYLENPKDFKLSPVYNGLGEITDFIATMSHADKREFKKMDGRGTENLARSQGHVGQAAKARQVNLGLLIKLKADYDKNYKSNPNKYERIVPRKGTKKKKGLTTKEQRVEDAEIKNAELYALLPKGTKEDIKKVFGDTPLMVRRDLIMPLMGYREASVADLFKTDKILSEKAKTNIRMAEKYWQDLMQIAKGNIVLKTPAVLTANILSNAKLLLLSGLNPVQGTKLMTQAAEQLVQYEKDKKELSRLEREYKAKISDERVRIAQLKDAIQRNKVRPLIEAGLYQSVVEDVSHADDTNRVSKWSMDKLNEWVDPDSKVTAPLNVAVNYAFMTDKTAPYRVALKATQVSDFYARYAQYYNAIEDRGHTPERAMRDAIDNFINYEAPLNSVVHYLDRTGALFFVNYLIKSQRVVVKLAKRHPVRSAIDIGSQAFITGDTPDIWDAHLIDRDLGQVLNPFKIVGHVGEVMMPSTVDIAMDMI